MSVFQPDILRGKVAFIAGGTSGINLEIARTLAEYGAKVAVLSRSEDKVKAAVAELERLGPGAAGFSGDVRDFAAVDGAVKGAVAALGPLDIVVSGAAGNFVCPAAKLSSNAFKAVMDIDLLGTFHVLRAAYDVITKPGGVMINISAPQSTVAQWGQAHVSAAKAGIDMLTRSLALEWGPEGIRVNGIIPGPIDGTEGMSRLTPTPESRRAAESGIPLGRYGRMREVGEMALFLSTPAASYVTGTMMYCDGGTVLSGPRKYGAGQ